VLKHNTVWLRSCWMLWFWFSCRKILWKSSWIRIFYCSPAKESRIMPLVPSCFIVRTSRWKVPCMPHLVETVDANLALVMPDQGFLTSNKIIISMKQILNSSSLCCI
jgi:hypothetical protein